MRRIVLSAEARRDLRKVWSSIAPDNRDAADEMCEKLHDALELIAQMPGIGHNRAEVSEKKYRFWAVKPFVIAYRVSSKRVTIMRIVHGARDFRTLFDQR
jgi:toxin ParE1/3/4